MRVMLTLLFLLPNTVIHAKDKFYVWSFSNRDGHETRLSQKLTLEFEEALVNLSCLKVLERRNIAELIMHRKSELIINGVEHIIAEDKARLFNEQATGVIFGEVYHDSESGEFRVAVKIQLFDSTIKATVSLLIRQGLILDARSREEQMYLLVAKLNEILDCSTLELEDFPSYKLRNMLKIDRDRALEAYQLSEVGRHVDSLAIFAGLSEKELELGYSGFKLVRSFLYREASFLGIDAVRQQNFVRAGFFIEEGLRPGEPDFTEPYDVYHGVLYFLHALCLWDSGKNEEAFMMIEGARKEWKEIPDNELAKEWIFRTREVSQQLGKIVINVGKLVTNRGFFQRWIGLVRSRDGGQIEVEITYVAEGLRTGLRKGQIKPFSISDIQIFDRYSLSSFRESIIDGSFFDIYK